MPGSYNTQYKTKREITLYGDKPTHITFDDKHECATYFMELWKSAISYEKNSN